MRGSNPLRYALAMRLCFRHTTRTSHRRRSFPTRTVRGAAYGHTPCALPRSCPHRRPHRRSHAHGRAERPRPRGRREASRRRCGCGVRHVDEGAGRAERGPGDAGVRGVDEREHDEQLRRSRRLVGLVVALRTSERCRVRDAPDGERRAVGPSSRRERACIGLGVAWRRWEVDARARPPHAPSGRCRFSRCSCARAPPAPRNLHARAVATRASAGSSARARSRFQRV